MTDIDYELKVEIYPYEYDPIYYNKAFDSESELETAFEALCGIMSKLTAHLCTPIAAGRVQKSKHDWANCKVYTHTIHFNQGKITETNRYDNN